MMFWSVIKISPSLRNLVRTFDWKDDFCFLNPDSKDMKHFYEFPKPGSTRLDRSYSWGGLKPVSAFYQSLGFTDHMALIVSYKLPQHIERKLLPRSRLYFKVKKNILEDKIFRQNLQEQVIHWSNLYENDVPVLTVWEQLVKPSIRQLA